MVLAFRIADLFFRSYLDAFQRSDEIGGNRNVSSPQNADEYELKPGSNLTNRTREPFTIQIFGRTFYMITAPQDAFAAYKASTVLSFDSFLDESLRAFGVDESSLKLAWHKPIPEDVCYRDPNPVNPKQKSFIHWIRDIYRQALLPGEKMNDMVAHFHSYVNPNLQWERVSSFALSQGEKQGSIRLSLKDFTTTIMLEAITDSMFGDQLVKVEPNIIDYAAELNNEAWMLVYRLPKYFAGRVLDKRMKIMRALEKYRQIPQEERTAGGEAWSVEMVLKAQDILGMSSESNNAFVTLIHWAYVTPSPCEITALTSGQGERQHIHALLLASLVHPMGQIPPRAHPT